MKPLSEMTTIDEVTDWLKQEVKDVYHHTDFKAALQSAIKIDLIKAEESFVNCKDALLKECQNLVNALTMPEEK